MLDEQFNTNPEYYEFVNKNFVAMHFLRSDSGGTEMFELYEVKSTPTVVVAEADGKEIDRIVGYSPPPGIFLNNLKKAYNRVDTFDKLKEHYEKNPKDLENAFKLAYKYERVFRDRDKAKQIYNEIIKNPDVARNITVEYTIPGEKINLYEWTLYQLGMMGGTNYSPFMKLIDEFPDSRFSEAAYERIAIYMPAQERTEEADRFFERLLEKYPENMKLLNHYIEYCTRTESNIDKGIEVANKVTKTYNGLLNINLAYANYARLLEMKGDEEGAKNVYGPSFVSRMRSNLEIALINYTGYWARKSGNDESLEEALDLLLKIDTYGRNISIVASNYISRDKMDKAIEIFGLDYLAENKDDAGKVAQYANFWANQGENLESALEAVKLYEELRPERKLLDTLEKIYLKMGKEEEARKLGEKFIEINKNNWIALNNYAWSWALKEKNLENALKAAKLATEASTEANNWDTLSMVYWKMKKYQEAIEAEEKALELSPGNKSYLKRIEDIKKDIKKKNDK